MFRQLLVVILVGACSSDAVGIRPASDVRSGALGAAVDGFVAAGRTPAAYAELARVVAALRPDAPKPFVDQAELELVVLALEPVRAVRARSMAEQTELLALTVWPTLLAPALQAPPQPELEPRRGEDPARYVRRLCGGPLAATCQRTVPELQGEVVLALAIHRAASRARAAIAGCLPCGRDPGWHEIGLAWEQLDRAASGTSGELLRRAEPDNWPVAGAAAADAPGLDEVELTARGNVLVGDRDLGPDRVGVLRGLRDEGEVLALHLRPDASLAQVRAALGDARAAGCARVALIAREAGYPWGRRAYWVGPGQALPAGTSLQQVLQALDAAARPTVARAD